MAAPSRPPNFANYGVKPICEGCGRKLTATETRWFVGLPRRAVFGYCCWDKAARV